MTLSCQLETLDGPYVRRLLHSVFTPFLLGEDIFLNSGKLEHSIKKSVWNNLSLTTWKWWSWWMLSFIYKWKVFVFWSDDLPSFTLFCWDQALMATRCKWVCVWILFSVIGRIIWWTSPICAVKENSRVYLIHFLLTCYF